MSQTDLPKNESGDTPVKKPFPANERFVHRTVDASGKIVKTISVSEGLQEGRQ
ncbi:MAG TPA: hypothetical protein VFK44_14785 [Bacillales bacterium]|nr:hypothetical protein [Bacillales bacterium]